VNIINDFFYLSWESTPVCSVEPIREDDCYQALLMQDAVLFYDALVIVLSISAVTVERFMALDEMHEALNYLAEHEMSHWEHTDIYATQCRILSFLIYQGDMGLNKSIGQRLDILRKEGIIGYDTSRKLISMLTLIEEKRIVDSVGEKVSVERIEEEAGSYYESARNRLHKGVEQAALNIEEQSLLARLKGIPEKLANQRFSIGITGVMNAGKSTMLNALLGEEILGTSVVPETANLTVIKYAKDPKAVVNFWREREWQQIEQSAQTLGSMQTFVRETQKHFGLGLSDYITDEGRSEAVSIEALPSYTSAEHSDKRCNLVKSVDLYHDLEFVRGGVEIVDTPGLDDPVIQREEITKGYLLECDLMCHLMNVGQSATQKDIAFIIDTLLYRNVAQLLIVITRIDMVSEEELAEVIAYTKSSIQSTLEGLGKGAQFGSILDRIHFIPIAGKMALLHRIGKAEEATAAGYDLERSGILEIEAYLREVLFGEDSQKAKLILSSANKELLHILDAQLQSYTQEQTLLGKSAEEITQAYAQYQKEITQTKAKMQQLDEAIGQSREELVTYFDILDTLAANRLQSLQAILKRRITDDVSYTLRKEKKKPTPERIATMIETGMQDGFIDLLREYRYGFQKRVEELMERLSRMFEGFDAQQTAAVQDAKAFFEQHFAGLDIVQSHTLLITQVNRAIAKHGKKEQTALAVTLEGYLSEAMMRLGETFQAHAKSVQQALLVGFEQRASEPLHRVRFEIESRESLLVEAKRRAQDSSFDTQERSRVLSAKRELLSQLRREILQGGVL
jgi:tRNA U34 5-carboxymethylaminomethyl modifying GTPase MnmE/TrmE